MAWATRWFSRERIFINVRFNAPEKGAILPLAVLNRYRGQAELLPGGVSQKLFAV
jgi:hypothetical protein